MSTKIGSEIAAQPYPFNPLAQGWLAVFQAWVALVTASAFIGYLSASRSVVGALASLAVRNTLAGFLLALPGTGLVLIARRSHWTRRYWILLLSASAVAAFVAFANATSDEQIARTYFQTSLVCLLWLAYWVRSRRVRATFLGPRASASPAGEVSASVE